jgi:hypothetical protein
MLLWVMFLPAILDQDEAKVDYGFTKTLQAKFLAN